MHQRCFRSLWVSIFTILFSFTPQSASILQTKQGFIHSYRFSSWSIETLGPPVRPNPDSPSLEQDVRLVVMNYLQIHFQIHPIHNLRHSHSFSNRPTTVTPTKITTEQPFRSRAPIKKRSAGRALSTWTMQNTETDCRLQQSSPLKEQTITSTTKMIPCLKSPAPTTTTTTKDPLYVYGEVGLPRFIIKQMHRYKSPTDTLMSPASRFVRFKKKPTTDKIQRFSYK